MLNAVILDDDAYSRHAAEIALRNSSVPVQIQGIFTNGDELFSFLQQKTADFIVLDIELHEDTGFRIARELQQIRPNLKIIFLTGHASYAIDGYDFNPVTFLTKPIREDRLERALREIQSEMEERTLQRQHAKVMFRTDKGYEIIDVYDILYVERNDRKNYMILDQNQRRKLPGYTMQELFEMLEPYGFFQCYQSFLISLYRVSRVYDAGNQLYELELSGGDKAIPVSRNHYEELIHQLEKIGKRA